MNVIFSLNHPAHYYLFKYIIYELKKQNHKVRIIIKNKDILEELLKLENVEYFKLIDAQRRNPSSISIISNLIWETLQQNMKLYNFCESFNPDIMIGTDSSITHVGKLRNVNSLVYNEDDFEINKLFWSFGSSN